MGYGYDPICQSCGTKFSVSEGSGMVALPFRCDQCGKEWWWEFGPGGPVGKRSCSTAMRMRRNIPSRRVATLPQLPVGPLSSRIPRSRR
jgi:hypothetical protein